MIGRTARFLAGVALGLGALGLIVYVLVIATMAPAEDPQADAIVVLTGNGGPRVQTGLRLLEEGRGERLLISGVSEEATQDDIRAMAPDNAKRFDCCVDLDRIASDTAGNARETASWAREHGYSTILLVTHASHMPRAQLELKHAAPEVEFIPHPVGGWAELGVRRTLVEYAKLVVISGREVLGKVQAAV